MNPELTVENIKKVFNEMEGFSSHNKMKIEELEDEKAVLSAIVDEKAVNPSNICHGGLVFGLADTAMGTLAYLTGRKVVTVDSNINYLKPCPKGKITCIALPVKVGKTLGVYEAKIYNNEEELAALITGTYFFLDHDINKK